MRKTITATCLILSGLIILDSLNAGHALMMFLLAGVIPGTSMVLNAQLTMQLFAVLFGFVLARLVSRLRVARYSQPKAAILAK